MMATGGTVKPGSVWPKVILFGDSLTQKSFDPEGCWGALVANYLIRKCDVIARGFSGYTTRSCWAILPEAIEAGIAKNVVLFTIFLGANDSNDAIRNPKQHVPLEEYKENLVKMVKHLESIGIGTEKIVILGPPAVDEEKWSAHARETKGKESGKRQDLTKLYSEASRDVASQCGAEFVDVFSAMLKSENWPSYLVDGLHFSTKGSQLVFDLLKTPIDKRTSSLPMLFPAWEDIV